MNELKRAWVGSGRYLVNHIIIRDWRFALPELAALAAGDISLWAWPLLIILIFPIAIVFAVLGRHFPHAGGVAHFVGMAFGPRLQRVISWLFYQSFLLVFRSLAYCGGFRPGAVWLAKRTALIWGAGYSRFAMVYGIARRQLQRQPASHYRWINYRAYCRHSVERRD